MTPFDHTHEIHTHKNTYIKYTRTQVPMHHHIECPLSYAPQVGTPYLDTPPLRHTPKQAHTPPRHATLGGTTNQNYVPLILGCRYRTPKIRRQFVEPHIYMYISFICLIYIVTFLIAFYLFSFPKSTLINFINEHFQKHSKSIFLKLENTSKFNLYSICRNDFNILN